MFRLNVHNINLTWKGTTYSNYYLRLILIGFHLSLDIHDINIFIKLQLLLYIFYNNYDYFT